MPTGNAIGNTNRSIAPATTSRPVETSSNNSIAAVSGQKPMLLLDLPDQPMAHMLGFLKYRDIKAMAQTCSSLHSTIRAEHLLARTWFEQFEPRQQHHFAQIANNISNHELRAWLRQFTRNKTLISDICGHLAGKVTDDGLPPREPQKGKYFPQILFYTVGRLMANCDTFYPELATFIESTSRIGESAALSTDASYLATYRGVKIYNRVKNYTRPARIAIPHKAQVKRIIFSADNQHILSQAAKSANITSVNVGGSWTEKLTIRSDQFIRSVTFSPDSRCAVIAGSDCTAIICTMDQAGCWAATGTINHKKDVWSAKFSPDSSLIVTASDDHTAKIHGRDINGQWLERATLNHNGRVTTAEFSPDGKHVITICDDENNRPERIATLYSSNTDSRWTTQISVTHCYQIISASFSPDSRHAVTASDDYTARILSCDAHNSWQEKNAINHKLSIHSASFSPDSHYLVTASNDGQAKIYRYDANVRNWSERHVITHKLWVCSATFSADGHHVLTFSNTSSALMSGPDFNAMIHTRTANDNWIISGNFAPKGGVYSAQFNHDGSHVAILARNDCNVLIYGYTADGKWIEKATLHHRYTLKSATFNASGSHLMTISDDAHRMQVGRLYKADLAPPSLRSDRCTTTNKKTRKTTLKTHR